MMGNPVSVESTGSRHQTFVSAGPGVEGKSSQAYVEKNLRFLPVPISKLYMLQ
jgi:hypothetical protein